MRTLFLTGLVAGAMLFAGAPSRAQDVQTILSKVAAAYKNAKSYQAQATMTQVRQMGSQKQQNTSTITTKFKAPNKMVTIVEGRDRLQVYSDGKTMYIYSPKDKEYMKAPAPASLATAGSGIGSGDPSQIGVQLQAMFGTNAKKLADRRVGGKPVFVIQSTQSQQSPDGKSSIRMTATALIDKATYVVHQIIIEGTRSMGTQKMADNITITFASQQINPNLPDSVFAFKPPAGAKERQMQMPSPGGPPAPR
ncbi:Outer-membrane lipoprotein carrier protein [bacterium HR16]|nr:Outer-membrane lipoprotein carrier protein [bacterium HR16]